MRKKNILCKKSHCNQSAKIEGFCQEHYDEYDESRRCRNEAIYALHHDVLDGRKIEDKELADEFRRLRHWWQRACDAVNFQREDPALRDEAEFALDWCISLALIIIEEEKAVRLGADRHRLWDSRREWVWERFKNLEAGLMSNGVARRTGK